MAHYVLLAKLTHQGVTRINGKEIHDRWDSFVKLLESKGGKLVAFYATLGRYDYIMIADLPSDLAAMEVSLAMGKRGNVTIETCRAFEYAEFAKAVESAASG
jgi:uncharacterized protein with GYD domain